MKRYKSLFERLKNTDTIEFYVKNKKIYVLHNDDVYLIDDFWKQEGVDQLLYRVFKELEKQYPKQIQGILTNSKYGEDWRSMLLRFINIYFSALDIKYDIQSNNSTISFNLER